MTCPWTGKEFPIQKNVCPILWHTLYPYFLGFVFGADYGNKDGDCNVGCPAEKGVDLVVRKRQHSDVRYDDRMADIPGDWRDVIYAEVIRVNGPCDYFHKMGDIVLFPTYAKEKFLCPALIYNSFMFHAEVQPFYLKCINTWKLRCPDWKENVTL